VKVPSEVKPVKWKRRLALTLDEESKKERETPVPWTIDGGRLSIGKIGP